MGYPGHSEAGARVRVRVRVGARVRLRLRLRVRVTQAIRKPGASSLEKVSSRTCSGYQG